MDIPWGLQPLCPPWMSGGDFGTCPQFTAGRRLKPAEEETGFSWAPMHPVLTRASPQSNSGVAKFLCKAQIASRLCGPYNLCSNYSTLPCGTKVIINNKYTKGHSFYPMQLFFFFFNQNRAWPAGVVCWALGLFTSPLQALSSLQSFSSNAIDLERNYSANPNILIWFNLSSTHLEIRSGRGETE